VGRSARDPNQFALIESTSRRGAAIRLRQLWWTRFDASIPIAGRRPPTRRALSKAGRAAVEETVPPLTFFCIRRHRLAELQNTGGSCLAHHQSETFVTGAAFGIAGESDTVERLRTPSIVSNLGSSRTRTACGNRLLVKDDVRKPRTRSPYRPRRPRPREKIAHTISFDDSFRARPRPLTRTWSKDTFDRLLPS